jgi:uncharacterized protein with NRDE domain
MCLMAFDWQPQARGDTHRLLLVANRDEFFDRPTHALHWWAGKDGDLLAGKDLREGGTWMGITRAGRFAALTNYRSPHEKQTGKSSRGHIVTAFLRSQLAPAAYIAVLAKQKDQFNGFNLICGDIPQQELWYYSNRSPAPVPLAAGVYGVSNALLDTPWPKVIETKMALKHALGLPAHEQLPAMKALLRQAAPAADDMLPNTGIALDWERRLSAVFIAAKDDANMPMYGTRSCAVLRIGEHQASWHETTIASKGECGDSSVDFSLTLMR